MEQNSKSILLKFVLLHCISYSFFAILFRTLEDPAPVTTIKYINTEFAKDVNYVLINKSEISDTKFVNTKLNARNVLEILISNVTTDALTNYYKEYVEPYLKKGKYTGPLRGKKGHRFFSTSPSHWNSDIRWVSVDSLSTYYHLLPYFDEMDLTNIFKHIIDIDTRIIIYSIFFVVRSKIRSYNFHNDFHKGTNVNGFSLLTPLQVNSSLNLAYYDINGKKRRYRYKKGIGIAFGENFIHSSDITTEENDEEVIFCFSFGTDKMRDWDVIKTTAAEQGNHYMHPRDGFAKGRYK